MTSYLGVVPACAGTTEEDEAPSRLSCAYRRVDADHFDGFAQTPRFCMSATCLSMTSRL